MSETEAQYRVWPGQGWPETPAKQADVSLAAIREAKTAMEEEIREASVQAVERFKAATGGLTPRGIDISLTYMHMINNVLPTHYVSSVRTTVDVL